MISKEQWWEFRGNYYKSNYMFKTVDGSEPKQLPESIESLQITTVFVLLQWVIAADLLLWKPLSKTWNTQHDLMKYPFSIDQ